MNSDMLLILPKIRRIFRLVFVIVGQSFKEFISLADISTIVCCDNLR